LLTQTTLLLIRTRSRDAFASEPLRSRARKPFARASLKGKGRRSAERREVDPAGPPNERCRPSCVRRGARPFRRRARLPALYRGSRQKPSGLGSVRSRASWSRTTDPLPGQPAPGRPAFGRPGEFPNRTNAVCETASAHRSRSTFRIASGMCPRTSEMSSFSSQRGVRPTNSAGRSHPSDMTRVFVERLFDRWAPKVWHADDSHLFHHGAGNREICELRHRNAFEAKAILIPRESRLHWPVLAPSGHRAQVGFSPADLSPARSVRA
jgi:hypothetical protein